MTSIRIGVRDLKSRAPALVRAAARGTQVVVTRYGRPLATLGPWSPQPRGEGQGAAECLADKAALEEAMPHLERSHAGRFVAFHGGRVVGSDTDAERLFQRTWLKLRGGAFFIGRVGAEPVIDVPGVVVE